MNEPPGEQHAAMNAQKSSAEVLQELLEAHRDETISRVIGYDPQAVLAKLLDTSLEDVVQGVGVKNAGLGGRRGAKGVYATGYLAGRATTAS